MTTKTEDKLADAKRQALAQFESIREMVQDLECAESAADPEADTPESARQRIHEDALSVQVRSGWYQPGADKEDRAPAEYEILLCTGGPAVRIVGELDQYCEPNTAVIECQDWFQPWTPVHDCTQEVLLTYARCFYFGEG